MLMRSAMPVDLLLRCFLSQSREAFCLWTLGSGGNKVWTPGRRQSEVCLGLIALSAVWWSGNEEQRIQNFLVDCFQSV